MTVPSSLASLLGLLHPLGHADKVCVIGHGCPSERAQPGSDSADLVILAPSRDDLETPGWLENAVQEAGAKLSDNGLLYALSDLRRRRQLHALLRRCRMSVRGSLLHHPDLCEARTLVPLTREALAHAFGRLIRANPARRRAALALLSAPGALTLARQTLPVLGLVAQRPGSDAPAEWFTRAAPCLAQNGRGFWSRSLRRRGSTGHGFGRVVLSASWRGPDGAVLLHAVDAQGEPLAIAKTWFGIDGEAAAAREADGLTDVAAVAAQFGVRVPHPLAQGRLGIQRYLVETAVSGQRAAALLQAHPEQLEPLLAKLTAWLTGWHTTHSRPATVTRTLLDECLLRPAAELGLDIAYGTHLQDLARDLEGVAVPLVPRHGDLTMVNILVKGPLDLGVIDWETGQTAGLPLGDFFYTVVDAVAALDDYRDRSAAFLKCFAPGGEYQPLVARLLAPVVAALGLTNDLVALCFHATWLASALDERHETRRAVPDEFLRVARLAAECDINLWNRGA